MFYALVYFVFSSQKVQNTHRRCPPHQHYIVTPDNHLYALTNICFAVDDLARYIRNPVCNSLSRDENVPQHRSEVPKMSRREKNNEDNKRRYHEMKKVAEHGDQQASLRTNAKKRAKKSSKRYYAKQKTKRSESGSPN